MIILDTNVLSALMNDAPDDVVVRWLDGQPQNSIWTTAVTVFEIELGIRILPVGRRQATLQRSYEQCVERILQRRIADFDTVAAEEAAILSARRRRRGTPREIRDAMIAGVAVARGATLATRNTRHFADLPVPVVDPWAA